MTQAKYQILPPLSAEEYQTLTDSIAAVGVLQPVVVDEDGNVIDGHHRAQVCDELGIEYPTVTLDGLDDEGKVKQVLALNLGRRHLDYAQKRALVLELRERGMSIRAIEEATGIPRSSVWRFARVPNGTPGTFDKEAHQKIVENIREREARLRERAWVRALEDDLQTLEMSFETSPDLRSQIDMGLMTPDEAVDEYIEREWLLRVVADGVKELSDQLSEALSRIDGDILTLAQHMESTRQSSKTTRAQDWKLLLAQMQACGEILSELAAEWKRLLDL